MIYPFPLDNDGWSIFPTDGNLIYVNTDTGDDTTGDGTISNPYASYTGARSNISRRGPQTTFLMQSLPSETMVGGPAALTSDPYVSASASNNAVLMQNGTARLTDRFYGVRNFSLIGVTFYTPEKDPQSPGFDFSTAPTDFIEGGISSIGEPLHNVLVEGCFLKCGPMNIQNNKNLLDTNVIVRRCIFYYSWSHTGAHRQGFFASGLRHILLEECIFYHNGWLQSAASPSNVGEATIFNHNLYWANCENVTIRNTVSLLPSSIHFKFTSNPPGPNNEIYAKNITIHDCFLYDGEVSISLGGNDDFGNGPRWKDINVANCVITQVGLSRPTDRNLSWGIDCNDWEGGKVQGNIFSRFVYSNGYHIEVLGHSSDVIISDNTMYQSLTDLGLTGCIKLTGNNLTNITVEKNIVQSLASDGYLINVSDANALSNITFANNTYYSNNPTPFRVGTTDYTYEQWVSLTGEIGSEFIEIVFSDPDKTFEDYAALQGDTLEQAFDSIRDLDYKANSISNYAYNAENLLNYFRQNFTTA